MQPAPANVEVRPLEARYLEATADLVARAMDVDAAYQYLFADPVGRPARLFDLFIRNLRLHMAYRCTHVAVDAEQTVLGTATLRPPEGVPISKLTMLRHGLLPFGFKHGRAAVKRLLWLKQRYDALEAEHSQGKPHWYLHMMAVRPDVQGSGIGSHLLGQLLERRPHAESPHPVVLTTHLRQNLAFYRRGAFEVISETELHPPGGAPYPVWAMRRPTGTPAPS